jgi:hypothetical protein
VLQGGIIGPSDCHCRVINTQEEFIKENSGGSNLGDAIKQEEKEGRPLPLLHSVNKVEPEEAVQ